MSWRVITNKEAVNYSATRPRCDRALEEVTY